ncbi:thrombospondin type 3 repeat-containing protein [Myxococcota bacterium]|nr:thrombospondin type 3 repeat-containing protein [Myxococcota bacterium]
MMYAVTQASEILYRRFNGSSFQFTGHNNLPNAEALKINFSEESVRSAYYQAILIEPACNGVIDPEDFLDAIDSLDEYGYSTEYHAVVPQWRSPDRTSNVTAETVYVQPHQNYYQSYAVGGQTILSPTIALERSLHVNGAAYTVGALKDAIACTQEFQYFGMPLASVYLDAQGDYVTVDATGITKFPHAVVVIGWIDGVSQTDFIFLDNRHEAIQVLSSEYFVGHPEGFHLLKFLWNVPAPTVDDDGDLIPDIVDNCPAVDDDSQADLDDDGTGDPCDMDRDGDGVPNTGDPVLDLAPDEYWKALDLNGNSYNAWYLERSTTAQQVGNRYRTYGCESECLQYEPGNPYCLLDCESLGVDPVLPMENHDRCLRRNYYHPDCQAQVKTAADAAGQTLPNYLRSFHPCALVYPTKLQSYEDISARISAGELNFGWGTPGNFSFWLQERFLDCVNYMNPSHWTADRSISLSTITEGKSKYLGPGYYLMYSCEATAFQAYYEKNTEAPVGSYSGWSWMEVDDDHAMISGCPCQGEGVYPDGCATRCVDEDQGAEPQSDNSQSIASNSWDPLYSNNAPNSFSSDGPEALPPISSFSTNLKVTAAANTLILRKHEFFDYDYWIDDEGELEDYQELNPSLPGSFQMRYSKHNAFFSGVPIPGGYMGREIEAAEFSEAFHFTTQEGCTSRFAITNWVAANVRTIPAAALSGPQWGLWKVATEGQMVMGFDATGTRTHRMALIPDAVTAMRVLSTTDPENATFLAARTVSGVLNNFRKYRYSNFSMVDEGAVTVSGIPTLTSVSLVPLNDTTTLVVGKSTITTWKLYQLVVSGSTGTLTYLTSLGLTSSLQAIWEPSVKLVPRATIVTNAYSTVKRYTLSNSTLTLVYSISQNTPVNSLARTDQGLVAILGNAVTLLGESSPTTTVLGAYPDLPADLYGHTLVPRTSLRLWGKGGSGQLGGYQYYPMMDQWETVQCLQNL